MQRLFIFCIACGNTTILILFIFCQPIKKKRKERSVLEKCKVDICVHMSDQVRVTKKSNNDSSKPDNKRLEKAVKRRKARELEERKRLIDQVIQNYTDEIAGQEPDNRGPSARDIIYDNAVPDYEKVSDDFEKKEMRGKLCLLAHFVNLYAGAVEGKHACTVFYDEKGEM